MPTRALVFSALLLSGCWVADRITGPLGTPEDGSNDGCPSDEKFFREVVSAQILEPDCMQCHKAGGFAGGTRLIFATPDQPNHSVQNFETLRTFAGFEVDGTSLVLLKPTLEISHGGGQRFALGSERFTVLEDLVHRFSHPNECFGGERPTNCAEAGPHPGGSPLRPLTSTQWENTVRDLFHGSVDANGLFPKTSVTAGFSTFASANIVSESKAEDILLAAEEVARLATRDIGVLLECTAGQSEEQCVDAYVDRFGMRAYRRPLRDDERTLLRSLYRLPDFDLPEKVGMIIETVLQSPQFLYVDDTGGTDVGGGVEAVDGYAIAQRLSYFFWNTMPDEALFDAAPTLGDPELLRAQAERLIADPQAQEVVTAFHRDWLRISALEESSKDQSTYPDYSPAMAQSMTGEVDRFVRHVIFSEGGRFRDLLTSRVAFTDTLLDPLYGVDSGSSGPGDFRQVELPVGQRSGLLTRAAFLTKHAHDMSSAPIARGVFVIRNLLCQDLVIPPGLVSGELPPIEGSTVRERFAMHRSEPACAACHDTIDPLGFAFERYDGVGAFRDLYENGREIDTYGTNEMLSIDFDGALELTERLEDTSIVRDCYATQWFRYAVGRVEEDADCSLPSLQDRFRESAGDVKDLMIGIAVSDAFRFRRTSQ